MRRPFALGWRDGWILAGERSVESDLLADDFSTNKADWVDDAHASAGAYTGGAYKLSVTGYNGQNELARPSSAGSGLSGVTLMNLDASVDVRTLSGAAPR